MNRQKYSLLSFATTIIIVVVSCVTSAAEGKTGHYKHKQQRQAIPLGVIQGGALAFKNQNNVNETALISANQTAEWNKFQAMNNETIDKTLYNGTTNNGPYKEVIKQLNQSVPLINSTMLSAINKTQNGSTVAPITQNGKPVVSVINGTEIGEKAKNNENKTLSANFNSTTNTMTPVSSLTNNKERSDIFGEARTLPVKNDHHNIFIHLNKKEGDGGDGLDKKNKKDENHEDEREGIVIGPLDGPVPHDNGNGPQEKETKDLHQGNVSPKVSPGHTVDDNIKKPKSPKRPKRFVFDYKTNENNAERSPRNSFVEPYSLSRGAHTRMSRGRSRAIGRSFMDDGNRMSPSAVEQYPDGSPSSQQHQQPSSSYDTYFANQIRRAELPSSSYSPFDGNDYKSHLSRFGNEPRRRESDIGMYSNNPGSPSDAEISDLLKNDKDLQHLARSMPPGTKVVMNENGKEADLSNEIASYRNNEGMPQARDSMPRYPSEQRGGGAESEEQAQIDELVNNYQKTSSEDRLYKLMEQESERNRASSYGADLGGKQNYLSEQRQFQQSPQYGESLRDAQQQEQRQLQEFTGPLTDHDEESSYGDSSNRRGDIAEGRRDGEDYTPFTSFPTPAPEEGGYQETGSEMNSFLGSQQQEQSSSRSNGIEETGGFGGGSKEEESRFYPSKPHQHRRHHKHHNSGGGRGGGGGDISDRELISKLLDMLRDKEHARDVAQSESNFKYQQNPDPSYFMPEQNTFNPISQQQQSQSEFPGTGRSSFPQNPEFPSSRSSTFGPQQAQQAQPQDLVSTAEVPQAQNLLSSLIQNLERSNSVPYAPPLPIDQQSLFQQPSSQSFFHEPSSPPARGLRQAFQPAFAANTFTQFQPSIPTVGIPVLNVPDLSDLQRQQGVAMLMVKTPPGNFEEIDKKEAKKEKVEHKELTTDSGKRLLGSKKTTVADEEKKKQEEANDFSLTLKKAADFVLGNAVREGNISLTQRAAIERKLTTLLEGKFKNKTQGEVKTALKRAKIPGVCEDTIKDCFQFKEGGVCPFMKTFMKESCRKTCQDCSLDNGFDETKMEKFIKQGHQRVKTDIIQDLPGAFKSLQPSTAAKSPSSIGEKKKKLSRVPMDPVMYLSFETSNKKGVVADQSPNRNNAQLLKGSTISQHPLGTCGKVAEVNEGAIAWSGKTFKRKPKRAISILMWVKVNKSGLINWFANGKAGAKKKFYTKTEGAAVPPKVWTHVAGTFDDAKGLARIYVNGDLTQEEQQGPSGSLETDWLENGIGSLFGDDSLRYVDEFYIYDRALKSNEVRSLFNRCVFNRMVFHYGFQKGNNSIIYDQSGLENSGVMKSGAKQKEECGKCGYCLDLTQGADPQLDIQRVPIRGLPTSKVSITVWVILNSTRGVHNIFTTESGKGNIGYRLQVIDGGVRFAIGTDIESVPEIIDMWSQNKILVPEGLWTHITATYNNENGIGKIYVNGILKLQKIASPDKREDLPTNWDNEASVGDDTFRGFLDEFVIYNWQLDENEVIYVRDYCADKPKLVRFTVRVPLTKKTLVPHVGGGIVSSKSAHISPLAKSSAWWELYRTLERRQISKRAMKKMRELVENPEKAAILLKKKK